MAVVAALALSGCGEGDGGVVIVMPTGDGGADGGRFETSSGQNELDTAPPTCAPGSTLCSGSCVPVRDDPMNCGGCGAMCPSGSTCSAGMCMLPPTGS